MPTQEVSRGSGHVVLLDDGAAGLRAKVFLLADLCTANDQGASATVDNMQLVPEICTKHLVGGSSVQTVSIEQRPSWQLSDALPLADGSETGSEHKKTPQQRSAAVIKQQVTEYLRLAVRALGWQEQLSEVHLSKLAVPSATDALHAQRHLDFVCRVVCAVVRERHIPRDIRHMPGRIQKALAPCEQQQQQLGEEDGLDSEEAAMATLLAGEGGKGAAQTAKALPSAQEGLAVFEFFSGIGCVWPC